MAVLVVEQQAVLLVLDQLAVEPVEHLLALLLGHLDEAEVEVERQVGAAQGAQGEQALQATGPLRVEPVEALVEQREAALRGVRQGGQGEADLADRRAVVELAGIDRGGEDHSADPAGVGAQEAARGGVPEPRLGEVEHQPRLAGEAGGQADEGLAAVRRAELRLARRVPRALLGEQEGERRRRRGRRRERQGDLAQLLGALAVLLLIELALDQLVVEEAHQRRLAVLVAVEVELDHPRPLAVRLEAVGGRLEQGAAGGAGLAGQGDAARRVVAREERGQRGQGLGAGVLEEGVLVGGRGRFEGVGIGHGGRVVRGAGTAGGAARREAMLRDGGGGGNRRGLPVAEGRWIQSFPGGVVA